MIRGMSVVGPLTSDDPASIGPYRLEGVLGAGGMGVVYLGRAVDGSAAAVKVIHARLAAEDSFRSRFAREIQVARAVRGRWVAALLDGDAYASHPWMATEFVPAPTLDDVIADTGPLSERAVQMLALQLAGALARLHALGVVHRDLKPSNVLVAQDGPRLIDFGVAKAVESTALTYTGMVVGTPAFMSPEQAAGTAIGPPSDIFSLASLVVFAATGRHPFGHTDSPLAMLRRISDDPPDLAAMPHTLRVAIEPCFAKDSSVRPSAADLVARLVGLVAAPQGWGLLRDEDPTVIGPYRLLGRLGAGGTGQVFLGQDDPSDRAAAGGTDTSHAGEVGPRAGARLVAVKVIHRQYAQDPRFRERFVREIAIARGVHGPRVAALVDADPDGPSPWLATEYVPGSSLQAAVDTRGPMPLPMAISLAVGLGEALLLLHERGLVHLGLKPSNVLLALDGPKLIGFGIARVFDETAPTTAGGVLGASGFLAPEQAAGADVGPPADIFALAAVLVFAVTGRGPFGTGTALAQPRRVTDDAPDLTGVPPDLVDIAASCLERNPAHRPNVPAVLARLRELAPHSAAVSSRPSGTRPPPATTLHAATSADRPTRRVLSRRNLLIIGAVGVAALGTVGGVLLANTVPTRPERWSSKLPGNGDVLMAMSRDLLVMGPDNSVSAINRFDGSTEWTRPLGNEMSLTSRIDANSQACYISGRDGLQVLSLSNGQEMWRNPAASFAAASETRIFCMIYDDVVGPAGRQKSVAALTPDTGTVQWKLPIDGNEFIRETLHTSRYLHVMTGSRLLTLDNRTGALLWQVAEPKILSWAASDGGLVIHEPGQIRRFDQQTGSIAWLKTPPASTFGDRTSPRLSCNDQNLHLNDSSGQWYWRMSSGEELWSAGQSADSRGSQEWLNADTPVWHARDMIASIEEARNEIVESRRQRLTVRSVENGKKVWESPLPEAKPFRFDRARLIADASTNFYVLSFPAGSGENSSSAGSEESITLRAFAMTD